VGLGDDAAASLGVALSHNSCLRSLNLFGNKLTDEGAKLVFAGACLVSSPLRAVMQRGGPFANSTGYHFSLSLSLPTPAGLRLNRTLRSLDLGANDLTDACLPYMCEVLTEFKLSHAEVVERRKALLGGPPGGEESHSRPSSRSNTGITPKATPTMKKRTSAAPRTPTTKKAAGATAKRTIGKSSTRSKLQVDEPVREHPFLDNARKDEVRGIHLDPSFPRPRSPSRAYSCLYDSTLPQISSESQLVCARQSEPELARAVLDQTQPHSRCRSCRTHAQSAAHARRRRGACAT
jgi:hypothetical protein